MRGDHKMNSNSRKKLAGGMGWPIKHSLSPRLHGFWLRKHNINGAYLPLPIAPSNLDHALRALPRLGYCGVNLTVPHKEAALSIVDHADDVARRIGAVNTVFVSRDGSLKGTNTDGRGFIENVKTNATTWSASEGAAVVLGAGGSARAVVAGLVDSGCGKIILVNRTRRKAEKLAAHIGGSISVRSWSERHEALTSAALLVNTTTLGMKAQPPLDVDLTGLPSAAIVTDLVYAPLETQLLAEARGRGNPVVDGLGMLLYQAVPGFEGWFGIRPKVTPALRAHVLQDP